MKNFKVIVFITGILFLTSFSSCIFNFNGIKGNGEIKKESRTINDFSEIEISGVYKVYLTQGTSNSLTLEGDENLMQYITTKNEGNNLIIDSKENLNPTNDIIIYLSFVNLESIDLSGACEVVSQGQLKFDNLEIEGSGACEFTMDMNADKVDFDVSGASEMRLSGKANQVKIDGSGAIEIKAFDFVINDCDVELSGASKAKVNVVHNLSIDLSGASSFTYKGGAKILKQSISGASSIRSKE